VDPDAHVFDDLGADSMVMARFCARVRKQPDLPSVSIKDVYAHPTVRDLATALAPAAASAVVESPTPLPAPEPAERPAPASTAAYLMCGAMQFLFYLGYSALGIVLLMQGYHWISAGGSLFEQYLRAVAFGCVTVLGACTLPILAKWVLIGRWKPQQIPVWSLAYVRFWLVKTLIRSNPLVLLTGGRSQTSSSSPIHALYLKALGAKIGRGVAIYSRNVPVCTDLLTIGDGTVIRKDSFFTGYRAHDGVIQTGSITLGKNVFVGEATVLDIDTAMGDGAQLGHTSSLQSGQSVPAGERWQGSPAQPTEVDYRAVEEVDCSTARRAVYGVTQILTSLLITVPLSIGSLVVMTMVFPWLGTLLEPGPMALTEWSFYRNTLLISLVVFFGYAIIGLLYVVTVPRLFNLLIKPDKTYPLYGFHYGAHRMIARTTNGKFFLNLFGDSSYVVHYLRALGYDLGQVEQTGSNFGTHVKHETPFLAAVGRGTMVADGLSFINAEFSSTSFRLSRTAVGAHSFLGNNIAYSSQAKVGYNCLLGTKVQVPVDGAVRQNVGLLGSPSFEIPRTVARDTRLSHLGSQEDFQRRLATKNRHNLVTMALYLLVRWFSVFLFTVLAASSLELYSTYGAAVLALFNTGLLLVSVSYWVLVDRSVAWLGVLRPEGVSIYDRAFWRHERFWKVPSPRFPQMFNGTPFKNLVWRALGVRIGRRVFDDGCTIIEKKFTTIGDDCTLNLGSIVQCHSQEDGGFKSDRSTVGARSTLGVGAFVHYGVTVGDDSVVLADSFLMKGEDVPPNSRWGGNPARELRDDELPARLSALAARADDHDYDNHHDDARDDDRTGPSDHTMEDLMAAFREDDAVNDDPLAAIPVPRRGGRHRAHGRHLARTR
jgi:non-ribosomal peptide synthetase-like protein